MGAKLLQVLQRVAVPAVALEYGQHALVQIIIKGFDRYGGLQPSRHLIHTAGSHGVVGQAFEQAKMGGLKRVPGLVYPGIKFGGRRQARAGKESRGTPQAHRAFHLLKHRLWQRHGRRALRQRPGDLIGQVEEFEHVGAEARPVKAHLLAGDDQQGWIGQGFLQARERLPQAFARAVIRDVGPELKDQVSTRDARPLASQIIEQRAYLAPGNHQRLVAAVYRRRSEEEDTDAVRHELRGKGGSL